MIQILNKDIANKIAAGEVITGPVAVVKELVENAIDAGATSLTVEIKAGGKDYIRVTDNGWGIPAEEVEIAFAKHATGKIVTEEDLNAIGTLGFRGEALPSIATVSHLTMMTKTADQQVGTSITLEGGEIVEKKGVGMEMGTTVTVTNLFFNTPARRKFMKSDRGEAGLVLDYLSKAAIAYPEIRFKVINKGNILFNTKGKGDGLLAIATVYGSSLQEKLRPIQAENPEGTLSLRAYIAEPTENRPSKRQQIFFVNGRPIHDKVMESAVARAYKGRLFAGRYPVCYLFLETVPDMLDVNIHPGKDEVRFYEPEKVEEFIEKALLEGLQSKELVPSIKGGHLASAKTEGPFEKPEQGKQIGFGESPSQIFEAETAAQGERGDLNNPSSERKSAPERADGRLIPRQNLKPISSIAKEELPKGKVEKNWGFGKEVDIKNVLSDLRAKQSAKREEEAEEPIGARPIPQGQPFHFAGLEAKGIIFDTYILAADEDTFYLIDQHAAHERVMYEKILQSLKAGEGESQPLLLPVTFDAARDDEGRLSVLQELGFEVEEFGPSTYRATAIPVAFLPIDIGAFLADYMDEPAEDNLGEQLQNRIATMACKSAVKAHDKLKDEEIDALLVALDGCGNPFACPHGRPTFMKMSRSEIERNFKRK